jgi:hypothetical protein
MVVLSNTEIRKYKMANPAWLNKYLAMKPEVSKIFDDLEAYETFCKLELREINPAHLYDKGNENYRAFLNSQRPRRPWNGERKPYLGNKPRHNNYQ